MGRGLKCRLAVQGTVGANGSHATRVLDQGNRKAVDQPVPELHLFRGAEGVGLDGEGVERGPSGGKRSVYCLKPKVFGVWGGVYIVTENVYCHSGVSALCAT